MSKKKLTEQDKIELLFAHKLKNDFKWYADRFLKIRDKKSKLIPFTLNEAQNTFVKQIEKDRAAKKPLRYIILKARQLGFSTFTEGYIYWNTTTNEYINSLIIAHEDKATQNLFAMSKLFYDASPAEIQPMRKHSNEKAITFENPTQIEYDKRNNPGLRSKITVATAGTSDTARSGTFHNVHVSEIAFFPNPKNTMTALLQCVPDEPNTLVVMESTANGVGGYFYDMWNAAVEGKNDFVPLFFPWFTDSEYSKPFKSKKEKEKFIEKVNAPHIDNNNKEVKTEELLLVETFGLTYEQLNWRASTIENKCGGDVEMFHQEYPSTPDEAFIASGRPKFNTNALKEYRAYSEEATFIGDLEYTGKKLVLNPSEKGAYKMWSQPNKDRRYYIGVDIAEGLETGDYSVAVITDDDLNVVAKWRGHIDPDLFGKLIVKLAEYYNEAYVIPESNNHGLTTIKAMINDDYYNIYRSKIYDKMSESYTTKVGWSTNMRTKPLMIDKTAEYIREKLVGIKDDDIIDECFTYVIDSKGRTNAQQGKFDDCVIALSLAIQGFLENIGGEYTPEISDKLTKKKKKKSIDVIDIVDPLFENEETIEEYSKE